MNEYILSKWKVEAAKYGMPESQFDATIKILKGMKNKDKLMMKRQTNQYYSSDSDLSVQTDEDIQPKNYGGIDMFFFL